MLESGNAARERYDQMLMVGARTVFWVIPTYFVSSLLFMHQPLYAYWALGVAWGFATLGILSMRRGRTMLARFFVLATLIEAVTVLVLAGGPQSSHVGALFPAIAGSAFLLNIWATIWTTVWFCAVYAASLVLQSLGYYALRPEPDAVSVFAQLVSVCAFVIGVLYTYQRALAKLTQQQLELARREVEATAQHEARLLLERRLRQSEKMEAFGQFAGGVAHDFNNLLTGVMGHAELVELSLPETLPNRDELASSIQQIIETAQRGADITRGLLSFSRADSGHVLDVDVSSTLQKFEATLRRLLPEDVRLETAYEQALWTRVPLRAVEQIVMNLVTNGRDAMLHGGRISLACSSVVLTNALDTDTGQLDPGNYVELSVSDTGAGMSDEVRRRVFEPFFSTRRAGVGTGLGLSTVHGIVARAKGRIALDTSLGAGTTVSIYLPRLEPTPDASSVGQSSRPPKEHDGSERVLVCEDESTIITVVQRTLEQRGYTVYAFRDPLAALSAVEDGSIEPDVLVTDVVMPHMNGRVLSERVRAKRANLPVLYMSGHTDGILEARGVRREELLLLQKPFTSHELLAALDRCLQRV